MNDKIKNCCEMFSTYCELEKTIEQDIRAFIPDDTDYKLQWINIYDKPDRIRIRLAGSIDLKYINQISSYIGIMPKIKPNGVNDLFIDYIFPESSKNGGSD